MSETEGNASSETVTDPPAGGATDAAAPGGAQGALPDAGGTGGSPDPTAAASIDPRLAPYVDAVKRADLQRRTAAKPGVSLSTPPATPPIKDIPPARIAARAGDPGIDLGYDPGRNVLRDPPPQVVAVPMRPGDTQSPMQIQGITIPPAASMDTVTAVTTLNRILTDAKNWTAIFPHEVGGEAAYFLSFLRGLTARQQTRTNAQAYGQDLPDDPIDLAKHMPPPELAIMAQMAGEVLSVVRAYDRAMRAARISLAPDDQAVIDGAMDKLKQFAASIGR
jgi:hypothetical protein